MKEEFLEELKLLLKKYDVSVIFSDNYGQNDDGDEVFTGTDIYLRFGDSTDYSQTLNEMISNI